MWIPSRLGICEYVPSFLQPPFGPLVSGGIGKIERLQATEFSRRGTCRNAVELSVKMCTYMLPLASPRPSRARRETTVRQGPSSREPSPSARRSSGRGTRTPCSL